MDDAAAFLSALTQCGFTQPRQRTAVTTFGFSTCRELSNQNDDDLKNLWSSIQTNNRNLAVNQIVNVSAVAKKRLSSLRKEMKMRRNCNAEYDVGDINALTTNDINLLVNKHNAWEETLKSISDQKLPEINMPKLNRENWKEWKTSFFEQLYRTRGKNSIPLTYIIRDDAVGDYNGVHSSTEEQLVKCISLTGPNAAGDKDTVYSLLHQHLRETESKATIEAYERSRDGRSAYIALKNELETGSYASNLRTEATAMMANAVYKGELKNFTMQTYHGMHVKAHNMLVDGEAPMDEKMKITNFKNGITESVAIMYANFTSNRVAPTATFNTWYKEFSAMMQSHIASINKQKNSSSRNISQFDSSHENNSNRGRGRGRFSRNYRGRGRGRGRNFNSHRGRGNGKRTFTPQKSYTDEEWHNLTNEQKDEVKEYRNYLKYKSRKINEITVTNDDSSTIATQQSSTNNSGVNANSSTNGGSSCAASANRAGDAFAKKGPK